MFIEREAACLAAVFPVAEVDQPDAKDHQPIVSPVPRRRRRQQLPQHAQQLRAIDRPRLALQSFSGKAARPMHALSLIHI